MPTGLITQIGVQYPYGELGYLTPDGQGGMTSTQLTNFYAYGWVVSTDNAPQFSNDGQDSFVSVTVVDQTVSPPVVRIVRIHAPGADPGGVLVIPTDSRVEVVFTQAVYNYPYPVVFTPGTRRGPRSSSTSRP